MTHDSRDLSVLRHIIQYCDEIEAAVKTHRLTLDKVRSDNCQERHTLPTKRA